MVSYAEGKKNSSFVIPDSVQSIMKESFGKSPNLKEVVVPKSTYLIETSAFSDCESLELIAIDNNNCDISDGAISSNTKIKGHNISTARTYAEFNGNEFESNCIYEVDTIELTCTEQGYDIHECAGCGDSYIDNYTPATGHKYREIFSNICE